MTLVIDAGPLVVLSDAADPATGEIDRFLREYPGELVIPAPITAEVDYLIGERVGAQSRRTFLADLAAGRFTVACLDQDDHRTALELDARYADLDLGLADCSLVVIAQRYRTDRLFTFDHRHFRAVRPLDGSTAFVLLPADG